jgi:hypothetical protein
MKFELVESAAGEKKHTNQSSICTSEQKEEKNKSKIIAKRID